MKSYKEANTEMRAHYDEMQASVANKVDEVMNSFRQEKLHVAPRPTKAPEPQLQPAPALAKKRSWTPILGGTLVVMLAFWAGLDLILDRPSEEGSALLARAEATPRDRVVKIKPTVTPVAMSSNESTPEFMLGIGQESTMPEVSDPGVVVVQPQVHYSPLESKPSASPKVVAKSATKAKPSAKPAQQVERYSEDLTF